MAMDTFTEIERPNDIVREVSERRRKLNEIDMFGAHEAIVEYALSMQTKHGEEYCQKVRSYHALIGSGIPPEFAGRDDFPEPDSVLKFLTDLEEKLSQQK